MVLSAFGQGSVAIKSAEQGTGLGLPIVQAILAKHGGEHPWPIKRHLAHACARIDRIDSELRRQHTWSIERHLAHAIVEWRRLARCAGGGFGRGGLSASEWVHLRSEGIATTATFRRRCGGSGVVRIAGEQVANATKEAAATA